MIKAYNNYLLGGLPIKNKDCLLSSFMEALKFVKKNDSFKTVDLQRALKIGYGKVARIIDVLILLSIISANDEKPRTYKKIVLPEQLDFNTDFYYDGHVYEADNELNSGWDPALFRTEEECLNYIKNAYTEFKNPVYVIEKVLVGNGFEVVDKEVIEETSKDN